MTNDKLFNEILKSVSRSFYLSLKILPESMRPGVSLAYLLCRTADSVADTEVIPWDDRMKILKRFRDLFDHFPIPDDKLRGFLQDMAYANTAPKTTEGRLIQYFQDTAHFFNRAPKTDQAIIQEVVQAVIKGMEMDLTFFGDSDTTIRALPSRRDFNEYIRWIGGEPGRFWTKITLAHFPDLPVEDKRSWLEDGLLFGEGLQMVNILRDLPQDLKHGRCYLPFEVLKGHAIEPDAMQDEATEDFFIPIYHDFIQEAIHKLNHGMAYIRAIPPQYWRLRIAVWWPLAIGLKTLDRLKHTKIVLKSERVRKIPRWRTYGLMLNSFWQIWFNSVLERKVRQLEG